jgi:hypothetical protein
MNRKGLIWLCAALSVVAGAVAAAQIVVAQPALPQPDTQPPASARPVAGTPAAAQPAATATADSAEWGPGLHSVLKNPPSTSAVAVTPNDEPPLIAIPQPRATDTNVLRAAATAAPGTGVALAAGTSTTPADEAASRAAALAAADLLSAALAPTKDKPLVGRYWTLLEAETVGTGDRNRQMLIARAYWILSATQADYGWAVEESARLEQISPSRNPLDSAMLSAAQAAATARIQEARVAVVMAQQGLADPLALPVGNPLPLASDPPMVGAYRTYFDTLFAQRAAPSRLRMIDRTMPLRREVIETRAATVQAAASAVHFADDALGRAQPEVQIQTVLNCHLDLSHERRAFLAAVRDYNLDIAEYALNVADPTLPNERLVGMLIPAKPSGGTMPAGHEPDLTKPPADDPLMRSALPASDNRPRASHDPGRSPRVPGNGTNSAPGGPGAPLGATAPAASGSTPAFGGAGTAPGGDAPAYGRLPAAPGAASPSGAGTAPAFGGTDPSTGTIAPPAGGFGPATPASGPAIGSGTPAADSSPRVPPLVAPDSGTPPPSRGVAP